MSHVISDKARWNKWLETAAAANSAARSDPAVLMDLGRQLRSMTRDAIMRAKALDLIIGASGSTKQLPSAREDLTLLIAMVRKPLEAV